MALAAGRVGRHRHVLRLVRGVPRRRARPRAGQGVGPWRAGQVDGHRGRLRRMFIGANVLSIAADRLGRRRVFILNLLVYSLFSLAAAFSPNIGTFVVLRLIAGIGRDPQHGKRRLLLAFPCDLDRDAVRGGARVGGPRAGRGVLGLRGPDRVVVSGRRTARPSQHRSSARTGSAAVERAARAGSRLKRRRPTPSRPRRRTCPRAVAASSRCRSPRAADPARC